MNDIEDIKPGDIIHAYEESTYNQLLYVTEELALVYLSVAQGHAVTLESIANDAVVDGKFPVAHIQNLDFKILGNISELMELSKEEDK